MNICIDSINRKELFKTKSLGNVFILGDSYSTFCGYIPQGYVYYYGDESKNTDVTKVEQTWWYQVIEKTHSCLIENHSWSGTTICNTGYDGPNTKQSFVRRFDKLVDNEFFNKNNIDTVLVMGGQNDDGCGAPIGELKTDNWETADLLQFAPAVCYLMHRIKKTLPYARIIFVVNSDMKSEIMELQEEAAKIYNIEIIRLQGIHKVDGHPDIIGMKQIAEQIVENL